jgi:hypothetical protein
MSGLAAEVPSAPGVSHGPSTAWPIDCNTCLQNEEGVRQIGLNRRPIGNFLGADRQRRLLLRQGNGRWNGRRSFHSRL